MYKTCEAGIIRYVLPNQRCIKCKKMLEHPGPMLCPEHLKEAWEKIKAERRSV